MGSKIEVRLAPNSGFCFGVKRAISMAKAAAESGKKIVTLGPIIHNPQVVQKLRDMGVNDIENISEVNDETVIIRSHGIEQSLMKKLNDDGIEVIDATCPYVAKAQELANLLSREGYPVVIMGDEEHPEVQAICSNVEGEYYVLDKDKDLPKTYYPKLGLISQTTKRLNDFQELAGRLLPCAKELRIINTICKATSVRQQATISLARESDLMIVIGGHNSSNTKMLAKICKNIIETQHIETSVEINKQWFDGKKKIGLTAGASTPDWIIVNIYNEINKCAGNNSPLVNSIDEIPGYKE